MPTKMRWEFVPTVALAAAGLAGCSEPRGSLVYVLDGEQTVTLTPAATELTAQQGEAIALSVARQVTGNWRQVPLNEARGRCWQYRPPAASEPEVADDVQWIVDPEGSVQFHLEYRFDHKRLVTPIQKGTITLTPVTTVPCEPERRVEGPPITIEVN